MKRIVLIACVKMKLRRKAKARDMYVSPLFKLMLEYAGTLRPDDIFVLSAKYGVLPLDDEIEPYEATLNTMPAAQVREWAERTLGQLRQRADLEADHFIFLASRKYREHLVQHVRSSEIPLEGLRIGEQLHWLRERMG